MVGIGANCTIDNQWRVYADFATADVKSDPVATANTVQTTTIDFRSKVSGARLSYGF